jgi:hypothetical protein
MLTTRIDTLDTAALTGTPLVIMLGRCTVTGPEPARILRFDDAGQATMTAFGTIPLTEFRDGVVLLVERALADRDYPAVRRIQRHLVFCLIKFVWFPSQDTATPDPFGLGGDKGPLADLVYQLNTMENLPYLLSFPRAKSLTGALPPLPVLLLLPGDSLQDLAPHIRALSERFLIVCLSRALAFCRAAGVTPDIVVQLDTHGEQPNFYPDDMDLSATWLLALSCAPARKYLGRFAGVFWIDTAFPAMYGDHYEIRNSWLSSFIPMLGCAELLRPPALLVAGADLAFGCGAATGEGEPGLSDLDDLLAMTGVPLQTFPVRLGNGRTATTTMQFMATAYEAETIAAELLFKDKTPAYNISRTGLLDPEVFEHADPEAFLAAPPVNRPVFRKAMARASRTSLPDTATAKRIVYERLRQIDPALRQADALSTHDDLAPLADHPVLSAAKLLVHLHPVEDTATRLHMAREILRRYKTLLLRHATAFRLAEWAERGKVLPLLCLPDEAAPLTAALTERFPKARWRPVHTWENNANARNGETLVMRELPRFLRDNPVTLISRRHAAAADYLLSLLPQTGFLVVEDLLADPWPPARPAGGR